MSLILTLTINSVHTIFLVIKRTIQNGGSKVKGDYDTRGGSYTQGGPIYGVLKRVVLRGVYTDRGAILEILQYPIHITAVNRQVSVSCLVSHALL